MKRFARILAVSLLAALSAGPVPAAEPDIEELLYRATRYGNTEQRRAEKEAAREALFALGPQALREVMARAHLENVMLQVLAFELVEQRVPAETGAPVLADALASTNATTRRIAAYLLGFYPRAEPQVPALVAMLNTEAERNAALRTLGKWKVRAARKPARELLRATNERTRIVAVNALRDIGHEDDLPALIDALADPAVLVRNAAARAVAEQGWRAHRPLRRALDDSSGVQRRQIVRLFGVLKPSFVTRDLMRLLEDEDPGLREDAVWALERIDPYVLRRREITPLQQWPDPSF